MVFGITRVRDEDDIIASSLLRMLGQVDHVLIGEGGSTDDTREIIDRIAAHTGRVTVFDDEALNFEQRDVMTVYARVAREMGATFGVFYDTDEVWFADGGRIADVLMSLPQHILIVTARNLTHSVTSEDDPADTDVLHRMGWRSTQMLPLVKVACRLREDLSIGHGNHSAHYENERHPAERSGVLESRHFPYRSVEQLVKRVRIAYSMLKISGLPRDHGRHMWDMGECLERHGEEGLRQWFMNGMYFADPQSNPDLVFDPIPELPSPLSFRGEEAASTASATGVG